MPVIRRPPRNPEHREAVRLSWKSRHIPFGTILIGGLALAGVLSAIFMVLALGPSNPPFERNADEPSGAEMINRVEPATSRTF